MVRSVSVFAHHQQGFATTIRLVPRSSSFLTLGCIIIHPLFHNILFFCFVFDQKQNIYINKKRNTRRMRNPPHDVQIWSKEQSKPLVTKEGYTRGTKSLYKYNVSWPYKPNPRCTYQKSTKLNYISKDSV